MRVIQTVNDTIRLLFNPKTETFSLSDFLLVRDVDENFLGQVVEVYDDKFDQESNVAKIRLVYRIVNGNEIVPYNNYTPSRECEVAKIKQSEIEKCINLNKQVLNLGKSFKSGDDTKINLRFFENNCIIFADKYEQTNQIIEKLAPKLTEFRNIVVLDFSGAINFEGVSPFVAGENFRMPLSSTTIDYIRQKVLLRAKLQTQAVLGGIFEEVHSFLEESEENYVPYGRFLRVIQAQYKQTPAVELLVLISWLKKYARMGVFAKNKREFEGVLKSIEKNKITVLDLSPLKSEWQKEYLEYLTNAIKNDVFLFVRLNDNNISNDILNSIYLKKKNISFIPSLSYGFKKASYVMDFAQNYILMPTLNPKRDFTHANFQIQSLNKESFMIFGEDTKDFLFVIENPPVMKKRSGNSDLQASKMLISLNLQLEDVPPIELKSENFEIKNEPVKKKRLHEEIMLSDVLAMQEEETEEEEKKEELTAKYVVGEKEELIEETPTIEPKKETVEETPTPQEEFLGEEELDYFENEDNKPFKNIEEDNKLATREEEKEPEIDAPAQNLEETNEPIEKETLAFEPIQEKEPVIEGENIIDDSILDAIDEENGVVVAPEKETMEDSTLSSFEEKQETTPENESVSEKEPEIETDTAPNEKIEEAKTIGDKKAQDEPTIEAETKKEKPLPEIKEEALPETKEEESKPTEEDEEIDRKFAEIMEKADTEKNKEGMLQIDENISIDLNKIKKEAKSEEHKLPIFDDENEEEDKTPLTYKEGDTVQNEKYGTGVILKVLQHNERCLLQIDFPEIGNKRLLDPRMTKIKLVQKQDEEKSPSEE